MVHLLGEDVLLEHVRTRKAPPAMRRLRFVALLVLLTVGLGIGALAVPAGAGSTRTLLVATRDVTGNGWDGIYVQRYVIDVAPSGKFVGTGSYLGFASTGVDSMGDDVACGLTQSISGKVGAKASYVARYDAPEQAYWYDFAGRIDGTTIKGTGTNVNGQRFEIRNATAAEVAAAEASC